MTFKEKLAGYCTLFSSSSYLPRLPVHSVTQQPPFLHQVLLPFMFSGAAAAAVGIGGEESHNHFTLLGPCSVLQAGGVGTGERELSFSSPDETPAGFISHYIVALKCQAAHMNLLL